MAKHRRQTNTAARAAAATTALAAGAALIAPAAASAAEVRVPNSPIAVQVPGIETIPGVAAIPGIDAWIPSLKGAAATGDAQAAIARVKALPGVNNVPGFSAFIANVEKQVLPAQAATNYSAPAAAPQPAPAPQPSFAVRVVSIAQSKVGSPYVYGAAGPNAFDCSGFTSWVYAQAGKSIPRTSQAQAAAGQQVALSNIQPGDIVVYYGGASHVGIYVGNGQIIDALNSGIPVGYRDLHLMPIHSVVRF